MSRILKLSLAIAVLCTFLTQVQSLEAHATFKKALEKKYDKKIRVTCNMCHVKKEPKSKRSEFGELFFKEFKDLGLSAQWAALKGDERKKLETDVMIPEFLKALKVVVEKKNKDDEKYGDLIPAGEIPGSKLAKKKSSDGKKGDTPDVEHPQDGLKENGVLEELR